MSFSNLFFLFAFLPISLILYYIVPKVAKNTILVLLGLVFFAWGRPEYLVLLLLSILFSYFSGLQISRQKELGHEGRAKTVLITAVIFNLLLLGFYKYYDFLVENLNRLLGTSLSAPELPLPIGISFYTFSLLSYLFDVYREKAPALKNPLDFAVFVTFFPKLVSGPIVKYADMYAQIKERTVTADGFGAGIRLFLVGLGKKVLLSNTIGVTFNAIFALPTNSLSAASAWLGAICYSLMLYFDFSGYSDMAIGLAKLFGFEFSPNFNYPYLSNSITDFWRRWHISLGAWFRDYVYIPLGGSRVKTWKIIRNLLIVWALTGIWHGANWTFVVWGMYYGLLLVLEKFVFKHFLEKVPNVLRHLMTLLLVIVGWVFFFSDSLGGAITWLGRMFFVGPFVDATAKYYFSSCWPILLVAIFACTPIGVHIGSRIYRSKSKLRIAVCTVVFFAAILLLAIAGMTNDTYSSFLYFQF